MLSHNLPFASALSTLARRKSGVTTPSEGNCRRPGGWRSSLTPGHGRIQAGWFIGQRGTDQRRSIHDRGAVLPITLRNVVDRVKARSSPATRGGCISSRRPPRVSDARHWQPLDSRRLPLHGCKHTPPKECPIAAAMGPADSARATMTLVLQEVRVFSRRVAVRRHATRSRRRTARSAE